MIHPLKYLYYFFYKKYLKKYDVHISYSCLIDKRSIFEGRNKIYPKSHFINSEIGRGSYVGPNSLIINTTIGRYCSIGPRVKVICGNHPHTKIASTHPSFYSTAKQAGFTYVKKQLYDEFKYASPGRKKSVIIGSDVWIGSDVIILEGVTIGDGAIIGTGSLVTKDIPSYTISLGVPAKPKKKRFETHHIEFLTAEKWWENSEEWIQSNINLFQDINNLYEKLSKKN